MSGGSWQFPLLIGVLVGAVGATALSPQQSGATLTAQPLGQSKARPTSPAPVRPFRNCTEARAAGAAPVYRNDPGYGPWLDGDDDGIGCEPYHRR